MLREEWTVPCDMIDQAIAGYLDAGDFTASSPPPPRARRDSPGRSGPGRTVAELDAGELAAWFARTGVVHGPAT